MNGKEYKLLIRIAGAIDKSFGSSLAATETKLRSSVARMDADFKTLDKGYDKIAKAGKAAFGVVAKAAEIAAVAVGGAAVASIAVGSSFESAFAGVKKTVDATEAEYARLRRDVLDMSLTIPSSANDIAGTMEIAGQLGIANDTLTEFTKTMINLGVSTNMTAEDAASALARFANITSMANFDEKGFSNWERLGSTVVDLGNNFATTEEEIVTMATKLASTGDIVGLSEAQILGLATAMSSVGIKTEAGGSTMSKVLKKMQLAIETNSKSLADYAKVAGMTTEEFSTAFKDDAAVALTAFIGGLNDTERNGKSAVAVLDEMGLKEVRLSNTLLALSNAEDLMNSALVTANEAWNEGNALTEEAGKRYETVESKARIMLNSLKEMGVGIYDELRDPLVDVIDSIIGKIQSASEYVKSSNGISKWVSDIGAALPTVQRKVKQYGGAILSFFNPLIEAGKWMLKNPKVIVSFIAGIGTALVTYKIASTLTHIVSSLMSLSASTWVITGVIAAIGALVTAFTAYKFIQQEAIDQNLAEHFGKVRLSMEDLSQVAEHIVDSKSLEGVHQALAAFGDLDTLASDMDSAIQEIDKMNWKVSIGIELSEEENENYQAQIQNYVTAAQEYARQSQYAVSLNLSATIDESDLEKSNIADKINAFYSDKYTEIEQLGKRLNHTVTNAFNDGLLDIDEAKLITELQQQMARVEEQIAEGEYQATLSLLRNQYQSGASLDAESFQNLQTQLQEATNEKNSARENSYIKNVGAAANAYASGRISKAEYESFATSEAVALQEEKTKTTLESLNFQLETITSTYSEELGQYEQVLDEAIKKFASSAAEGTNPEAYINGITQYISTHLPTKSQDAVNQLLENMTDGIEQFEKVVNSGEWENFSEEAKAAIKETQKQIDFIKGYAGKYAESEGMRAAVTAAIADSEDIESYTWIDEIYRRITGHAKVVAEEEFNNLWFETQNSFNNIFGKGFSVDNIKVGLGLKPQIGSNGLNYNGSRIEKNANGGFIDHKVISWLGEEGPEAVIPLNGSARAMSLWRQAGQMLNMQGRLDGYDVSGGSGSPIVYSPTLQFYGEAPSKEDLNDALRMSQDEFDTMMARYMKRQSRMSLA